MSPQLGGRRRRLRPRAGRDARRLRLRFRHRLRRPHRRRRDGGAPGNWGLLDLDNTAPISDSDLQTWTRTGYAGSVRPGNVGGDTGAFHNSYDDDLSLVAGERFPIPVFDRVTGQGSTSKFHVVGFVNIELVGWRSTGSQHQRYLDVRFVEMVAAGECCDPGGRDFGLKVVHICDVDPEFDPSNCT
ncbi:MAG TPA: hypothetical protein VM618_05930 [Acidimicrobiia bacterium]|nr:hypothetical protein [Acidimicrobiia bacterium]